MKLKHLMMVAAVGLSAGTFLSDTASARPFILAKKGAPPANKHGAGPTTIEKKLALSPKGVHWGVSLDELSRLYSTAFDEEFRELYKRVEPGPRMKELDHELADKKQLIKRNWLEFGSLPSGLDQGPLGGEYSYKNNESMTKLKLRNGAERHFFFFNKRLWKVYDQHTLGASNKLGKSFDEVVENLAKKLGKKPRQRDADPAQKRYFNSADWTDGTTILRVYDLGGDQAGVVYIDEDTEKNLPKLRPHSNDNGDAIDPEIQAITKEDAPPPAEEPKKGGKKK